MQRSVLTLSFDNAVLRAVRLFTSQVGIGIAATCVATRLEACTAGAVTAYSAPWYVRTLSLGYTQQTVGFRAAIGASVMVSVSVAAHAALVGTADDAMGCGWFSSGILIRTLLPHIREPVQLMPRLRCRLRHLQ